MQHKWLGGAVFGRYVVGVPSHHWSVLKVDVISGEISYIETPARSGKFKWLRGVATDQGVVVGVPSSADAVLLVDPQTDSVALLPHGLEGKWKWHGGQVGGDGCVYAPPANAPGVLRVDPKRRTCEVLACDDPGGRSKYYGGLASEDGCVWGVPFAADRALKIDPKKMAAERVGRSLGGFGFDQNWHGGLRCERTGRLYGFPANADAVLRIDPATDRVDRLGVPGPRGRYQWAGGFQCASSGAIYGVPSDASDVLKIEVDGRVSRFGDLGRKKNKWQNAVEGPDGAFYCVPCDADAVLRIDPRDDSLGFLRGTIPPGKDKYQGAFYAGGAIWALPESADAVLRISFSGPPEVQLLPLY
ncbi:hypothetical protein CTAYLR_006202 [Chrysophaeum taylorii]|uniref:Uncharacterized protein n=1 Tax=Chrysophaeum taylorii TaxID=2483200 RepID=A0AAD7XTY1_9STRA|nr:hypothetical protein CTAYLR_006202 [Chrysophaeum taylorii]